MDSEGPSPEQTAAASRGTLRALLVGCGVVALLVTMCMGSIALLQCGEPPPRRDDDAPASKSR